MDAYIMTLMNTRAKSQTKCPLKRGTMTDSEYVAACQAIANAAKDALIRKEEEEAAAALAAEAGEAEETDAEASEEGDAAL